MTDKSKHFLIVGAGLSGAVLARALVEDINCSVTVWDSRDHVAGNCHTERDDVSGVMIHVYGPHIFNTDSEDAWLYLNRFGTMIPFANRVKSSTPRGIFSFPINLHTINQLFGKRFNPAEAREFVNSLTEKKYSDPANFEEQALSMVGEDIYKEFLYGYSKKQWGCEPRELPASVLKRLPIRFNYNDLFYEKKYQAVPKDGYTTIVSNILDHSQIDVQLSKHYDSTQTHDFDHVFYTGPIDSFFQHRFGRLGYRTIYFEKIEHVGDYQGNAVINYPSTEVPWTRVHEHNHFSPWEEHERHVVLREYSKETSSEDTPYYPKRLSGDLALLREYQSLAQTLNNTSFLGRLGTYRYLDMDKVIEESLQFANAVISATIQEKPIPTFSNI